MSFMTPQIYGVTHSHGVEQPFSEDFNPTLFEQILIELDIYENKLQEHIPLRTGNLPFEDRVVHFRNLSTPGPLVDRLYKRFGTLHGKRVLELDCGMGELLT